MEKKMMIIELTFIQNAQRKIRKIGFQSFSAHKPGKLDVVETVVIGHVRRDELDQSHTQKEEQEKCDGNKLFSHHGTLPGVRDNYPR